MSPTQPSRTGEGRSPFRSVGVVGCGLIGGSFAVAAAELPGVAEVVVHDADAGVSATARERGLGRVVDTPEAVAEVADLVVLAVPVPAIAAVAERVAIALGEDAVLTDVGSVKAPVVRAVEGIDALVGPAGVRYVGGHPMAGTEGEGIGAADPTLFQGAVHVLTPTPRTDGSALHALAGFLRALGCRVLAVDPAVHDRLVATVSHLPHVIASALMRHAADAAEEDPGLLTMAGGSFRDLIRVAGSNPDLWVGILRENRAALLPALDAFARQLAALRDAIASEEWSEVAAALLAAREARALLPKRDVGGVPIELVVPVDDRPGALAEVTTALGSAGINIADLTMRHAEAGDRGALVVTVSGREDAERARDLLARRGLISHLEDVR